MPGHDVKDHQANHNMLRGDAGSLKGWPLMKANLVVTLAMLLFSFSLPILEILGDQYSVTALVVVRNILSGGFLLVLGMMVERHHRLTRMGWRHAFYAGGFWYLVTMICLTYAVVFTGAFATAVILSLIPVVSALIDVATGQDRIGPRLALALLISISGGVLASVGFQETARFAIGFGEIMLFLGVSCWVMMSRYVDQNMKDEPPITGLGVIILLPGLMLLVVMIGLEVTGIEQSGIGKAMSQDDVMLMVFLGIVSSAGSMVFWFRGVARLGVTIASLQQNLVPVFVLVQIAILGQDLDPIKILGGVLVVMGALIAQIRRIKPS